MENYTVKFGKGRALDEGLYRNERGDLLDIFAEDRKLLITNT